MTIMIAAGVFGVALVLLFIGLRGRKVNEHPHCRKCGFDLLGLRAVACPECGSDLGRARAVRMGKRVRRWGFLAASVAPIVLVAAMFGASLANAKWAARINAATPTWLLLREAEWMGPMNLVGVLDELSSRELAGQLALSDRRSLCKTVVLVQSIKSAPWHEKWGDVVENAWIQTDVDDTLFRSYLDVALTAKFVARTALRTGDPLGIELHGSSARVGSGKLLTVAETYELRVCEGVKLHEPNQDLTRGRALTDGAGAMGTEFQIELPIGEHDLCCKYTWRVWSAATPDRLCEVSKEFRQPLTIRSSDSPSGLVAHQSETVRQWLQHAISIRSQASSDDQSVPLVLHAKREDPERGRKNRWLIREYVQFQGQPPGSDGVAIEIVARISGREFTFPGLSCDNQMWTFCGGCSLDIDLDVDGSGAPESAELILRSCERAAIARPGWASYWEGEVRIPNVRIEFSRLGIEK